MKAYLGFVFSTLFYFLFGYVLHSIDGFQLDGNFGIALAILSVAVAIRENK